MARPKRGALTSRRFCAMVSGGGGTVATPATEAEKTTPSSDSSEQQPPPVPPETGPPSLAADSQEGKPWALKLGEYLQRRSKGEVTEPDADAVPWAVQLGTYLREKQPGPWSLLANKKPQDPLVRCRSGACVASVGRRSGEPSAPLVRRRCASATSSTRPSPSKSSTRAATMLPASSQRSQRIRWYSGSETTCPARRRRRRAPGRHLLSRHPHLPQLRRSSLFRRQRPPRQCRQLQPPSPPLQCLKRERRELCFFS